MFGNLKTRLYCPDTLHAGAVIAPDEGQAHYLLSTLRAKPGEQLALFNAKEGEWCAEIASVAKKTLTLKVIERLRLPAPAPDIWLVFAPVKNEKIDYTVKRATELGVCALHPVMTERTIVSRVNTERLAANAVEAAEQSGRTDVPEMHEPVALPKLMGAWPKERILLFCDESGGGTPLKTLLPTLFQGPYGVLIGPEGGFTPQEQKMIRGLPFARGVSLGPRILRAETAALAALANVVAWVGDGEEQPRFEGPQ